MARDRGGSGLTVVIAFGANLAVAAAKTVAAVRLRDLEQQLERSPQTVDAVLTPALPDDR